MVPVSPCPSHDWDKHIPTLQSTLCLASQVVKDTHNSHHHNIQQFHTPDKSVNPS